MYNLDDGTTKTATTNWTVKFNQCILWHWWRRWSQCFETAESNGHIMRSQMQHYNILHCLLKKIFQFFLIIQYNAHTKMSVITTLLMGLAIINT